MNDLKIMKASGEDIDQIELIYGEAIDWQRNMGIYQWLRGVYPTRETAEQACSEKSLYILRCGDRAAGTFILNDIQPREYRDIVWRYSGSGLVIHTFITRPCETGKGLGTYMLKRIIAHARSAGCDFIRLDTFSGNCIAKHMYEKVGFELTGSVIFDIKEPGFDCYDCYELNLKS